jgi:hypothetical protein
MNIRLIIIAALLLLNALAKADPEVRRAEPVDKWRSLHGETCWQWLNRVGYCTTGGCEGGKSNDLAYLNWSDESAPFLDNIEMEPNEVLLAPYPFIEPDITNQAYDYDAETEIRTRSESDDIMISRVYRRGIFVGYVITQRKPLVKI